MRNSLVNLYPTTDYKTLERYGRCSGYCEYFQDVYATRDTLISGGSVRLVWEKDYKKKALTFYSQSLFLLLQCLCFIILPYKA